MPFPPPRPPAPNGPGVCNRCFAEVIWCVTVNKRAQMVDAAPDDNGNQAVRQDGTGRYLVRQLTKERPSVEGAEHLHMPHVATCRAPAAPRRTTTPTRMSSARVRQGVRPVRWQR
ncbi:hypothetical protein ACIQVK_25375 [Streptomyces sp. NPDC090493]|uniref:hypothetical protein n=1 Tax=Streptomyces sp. NPDC090493 TaxID=3365964 RepID=UPI0038278F49